jgi:hypothetical protein
MGSIRWIQCAPSIRRNGKHCDGLYRCSSPFYKYYIAGVNATVIWTSIHLPSTDDPLSRRRNRRLLIESDENLDEPWLAERSSFQQVIFHPEVRAAMKCVGAIPDQHVDTQPKDNRKLGRCFLYPKIKRAERVSSWLILPQICVPFPFKCSKNCYMLQLLRLVK